jgi:hypothetical protein
VSARYWVLVSDELMNAGLDLPDGLRVIEPGPYEPPAFGQHPVSRWRLFEDDGAPATLEGKRVELTFVRSGDGVMIGSRSPAI